jgi:hypothetical protein
MHNNAKQRIRWVLLSACGLGVGLAVGLALGDPVGALVGMMLVTPVILAVSGSILGASQSLALGRLDRSGLRWIAGSALGVGLGLTLGVVAVEQLGRALTGGQIRLVTLSPAGRTLGLCLAGTLTGIVVGAAQSFAMRRRLAGSGRWVLWCAMGFGVGLPGGGLAADALLGGLRSPAGFAVFLGAAGLIMGLLTAGGIDRLRPAFAGRLPAA